METMGIRKQTDFTSKPNWIAHNDFSTELRLHWAHQIMGFRPRDWSRYPRVGEVTPGAKDYEMYALYIVINANNAEDAWDMWVDFCKGDE